MDLNALSEWLTQFLQSSVGQIVANVTKVFYTLSYPANAPAAHLPTE
ncbi:hypothetical protein [Corynebacterium sp. 13CS0277]|nr:hypothetical protein [Corynebacterium sp. 13CS0277]